MLASVVNGQTKEYGCSLAASAHSMVMFAAAASAALRAIRRIASVRLLACWSVRWRLGIGGSGGKRACGASCGGASASL